MDEEVLNDLYNRALSQGYSKSIEEFSVLLSNDDEVLNDNFNYVTQKGYSKSIEEFSELIGVKKKDEILQEDMALLGEGGSVDSPAALFPSPEQQEINDNQALFEATKGEVLERDSESGVERGFTTQAGSLILDEDEDEKGLLADKGKGFDHFERAIGSLRDTEGDLITDWGEEYVVPKMNYLFGQYGFDFEDKGIGDNVKITASNGEEITINLDTFMELGDRKNVKNMENFLRENKSSILRDIGESELRVINEEEIVSTVKNFDAETKEFTEASGAWHKEYKNFLADFKQFEAYSPQELARNPELRDKYQESLQLQKNYQYQFKQLKEREKYFQSQAAKLDKVVGEYTEMQAKQGTFWEGIWNELVSYPGMAASTMERMAYKGLAEYVVDEKAVTPKYYAKKMGLDIPEGLDDKEAIEWLKSQDEEEKYVGSGIISTSHPIYDSIIAEAKDKFQKNILYGEEKYRNPYSSAAASTDTDFGMIDDAKKGGKLFKSANTTKQWKELHSQNFWEGSFLGLAASLPAMVGGLGPAGMAQRTAQMYAMSTEHVYDEMAKESLFDDISENEKFLVTAPIGIAIGILETIGFRNLTSSSPMVLNLVSRAITRSSKTTTAKTFGQFIKNDVKSGMAKGGLMVTAAGMAEFETGFMQEIAEISVKNIYNVAKEKQMFQTPDTFTEYVGQILRAGAQEAVGGFVLGTPGAVFTAASSGNMASVDDNVWSVFKGLATDPEYREMYKTKLKTQNAAGEITAQEMKDKETEMENLVGLLELIPIADYTPKQQREALGLLLQKQQLEKEIGTKDGALVKSKKKKVAAIVKKLEAMNDEVSTEMQEQKENEEDVLDLDEVEEINKKDDVTEEEKGDVEEFFGEKVDDTTEKVEVNLRINKKGDFNFSGLKKKIRNAVVTSAKLGARSISKILPDVRMILHESNDEYLKFTGRDGRGEYVDGTIHINLSKANMRTVPHEIFHAVFLDKVKNNSAAAKAAETMMMSVRKTLRDGSELANRIDNFAKNYVEEDAKGNPILDKDGNTIPLETQNEERLAELVSILASEYRHLTKPAKNKVIQFLKDFAKKFGIDLGENFGTTDDSVIDLLNTLGRKTRKGEVIEESDLTALDEISDSKKKPMSRQQREGSSYFSNALKAIDNIEDTNPKQPTQWIKALTDPQKNGGIGGVNQELGWIGLEEYLNKWQKENKTKSIPKEIVEQYINDNRIEIVDVQKGVVEDADKLSEEEVKRLEYLEKIDKENPNGAIEDIESGSYDEFLTLLNRRDNSNFESLYKLEEETRKLAQLKQRKGGYQAAKKLWDDNHRAMSRMETLELSPEGQGGIRNPSKYSQYTLENGENYQEVLLTLPNNKGEEYAEKMRNKYMKNYEGPIEIYANMSEQEKETQAKLNNESEVSYKSQHWDEKNILAHIRLNERTLPNGEKVIFIEELQSDWAQDGKRKGFKRELNEKEESEIKILEQEKNDILDGIKSYQYLKGLNNGEFDLAVFDAVEQTATSNISNPYFTEKKQKESFLEKISETLYYWKRNYNVPDLTQSQEEELYNLYLQDISKSGKELVEKVGYGTSYNLSETNEIKKLDNKIESIKYEVRKGNTPNMPYKKTDQWVGLAIRRVMKMAADKGFDRVAWITGEQSADRYDLSKTVDHIRSTPVVEGNRSEINERSDVEGDIMVYIEMTNNSMMTFKVDGKGVVVRSNATTSAQGISEGTLLSDIVGKEMAEKIISVEKETKLEGQDLKLGGEGMKTFYNSILPKVAKAEAKRFDKSAKIEVVDFKSPYDLESMANEQLSIAITPKMKEELEGGVGVTRQQKVPSNLTSEQQASIRQQKVEIDDEISNLEAKRKKINEAEYKKDKAGKPAYSKEFFAKEEELRKEIKRLELLKVDLAPAYEQRVKISEELDELNKPFQREVGNIYYPRLGTVSKGEMTSEESDLGGIYEAEVDGYLFRGVSLKDYNRIKKEGFIDTDLRGTLSDKEGINLATSSSTAFNYLPEKVEGVVMAIKVSDKSGLFMIGADDYVRSSKPIPFTDVEFVTTPVVEGRYISVKDGKSTPIAIEEVSHSLDKTKPMSRQQKMDRMSVTSRKARQYGMGDRGFFPPNINIQKVKSMFEPMGYTVEKSKLGKYGGGGGVFLRFNGVKFKPLAYTGRRQKSINEVIEEGRQGNFRDAVLRDFLVRVMRKSAKVVDAALKVSSDMFEKMPQSFKNMQGGIQSGERLYNKIEAFRKKLELRNSRSKYLTPAEMDAKVRAFAKEQRKSYDSTTQLREKVDAYRAKLTKSNNKRKNPLNKKDFNSKVAEFKAKLTERRDSERDSAQDKVNDFQKNEIRKNNKRVKILSEQEIMDAMIEYMQEQKEYKEEGDSYVEKGKTLYRKGISILQAQMTIELQKAVGIRPTQDMSAKIRKARISVRERLKGKRDIKRVKRALRNFMRVSLPKAIYTKGQVLKFAKQIEIADWDSIENLMNEITEFVISENVKTLQKSIDSLLNDKYTKTEGGRKKGIKIDVATLERLTSIRNRLLVKGKTDKEIAAITEEDVVQANTLLQKAWNELSIKTDATIEELTEMANLQVIMEFNNSLVMENTDSNKVASLDEVNTNLQEMVDFGRTVLQAILAKDKAEYERQFEIAYEEITGKVVSLKEEDAEAELERNKTGLQNIANKKLVAGRVKFFFQNFLQNAGDFFTDHEGLDGLMDKIGKLPGELFGGALQDMVTGKIDESSRTFKERTMYTSGRVEQKLVEIYGKNWKPKLRKNRQLAHTFSVNQEQLAKAQKAFDANPTPETQEKLDEAIDNSEKIYTQNQMSYLYNQHKDPSNDGAFETMYGPKYKEILSEIEEALTPEVKAFADWQVNELFPELYEHYNEVYKKIYRTNMPWNEFYSGRIYRDGVEVAPLDLLSGGTASFNNSVNEASTLSRIKNTVKILPMDGTDALMSYIHDMEYFAAYAESIRDINKIFTNEYIRGAIRSIHGDNTVKLIDNSIQKIANKGVQTEKWSKVFNAMNTMFIIARLAISPLIMIKQLTSTFTYANDIGSRNWLKYSAKNMIELNGVFQEMRDNSVYMQERGTQSLMRAMETYSESAMQEFVPSPTKDFMVNFMMYMVKFGDRNAIFLGGAANYSYYKDQAIQSGETEQEAIQIAIRKFERDTKRTQQSSDLQDKDFYQTGHPMQRAANFFLSTPRQYLRKDIQAVRNLGRKLKAWDRNAGKGSVKENLRTLLMYHVYMPVLFQYISMGLPGLLRGFREDDDEDLMRAAIMGPLNGLFIAGEVLGMGADYYQGKPWAGEGTKSLGLLNVATSIIQKLKAADKMKEGPKKDAKMKQAYLEMLTIVPPGIPAPTLSKLITNYGKVISGDYENTGEALLRLMNFSEYQITGPKNRDEKKAKTIEEINEEYDRQLRIEDTEMKRQQNLLGDGGFEEGFEEGGFEGGFEEGGFD